MDKIDLTKLSISDLYTIREFGIKKREFSMEKNNWTTLIGQASEEIVNRLEKVSGLKL